jgi:hypothetical protein
MPKNYGEDTVGDRIGHCHREQQNLEAPDTYKSSTTADIKHQQTPSPVITGTERSDTGVPGSQAV